MQQKTFYLEDEAATCALGKALAPVLCPGLKIYLHGDLGAGKTTLTRAIIRAAGHNGKVKSPTYTLVEPYTVSLSGQPKDLFHFDLYRMCSPEEFLDAGFREYFNENTVCIIEWAEKAEPILPAADLSVSLEIEGDGRRASLKACTGKGRQCLEKLNFKNRK